MPNTINQCRTYEDWATVVRLGPLYQHHENFVDPSGFVYTLNRPYFGANYREIFAAYMEERFFQVLEQAPEPSMIFSPASKRKAFTLWKENDYAVQGAIQATQWYLSELRGAPDFWDLPGKRKNYRHWVMVNEALRLVKWEFLDRGIVG